MLKLLKVKYPFFLAILFLSFQAGNFKQKVLRPSSGVDNIVLGKSTLDDVIKTYGYGSIKRVKVKSTETEICSHAEYEIYFVNEDILFKTSYPKKSKIVQTIIIGKNSNIKTENGFGVGSSYVEMLSKLGRSNDLNFIQLPNGIYETKVRIEKMHIYFDGRDTINGKVVRIEIR